MTICYLFPQVECLSRWPGQAENSDFSKRNAACCCWLEVCSQLALSGSIESVAIFHLTCRDYITSVHGNLAVIHQDVIRDLCAVMSLITTPAFRQSTLGIAARSGLCSLLSIQSCLQLGGLRPCLLGAVILLLSGKEILVNPSLRDLIILALQAFKPETHAHSPAHSSLKCYSREYCPG